MTSPSSAGTVSADTPTTTRVGGRLRLPRRSTGTRPIDVLYDAQSPRGKAITAGATVVSALGLVALVLWIVQQLRNHGEFESAYWKPFTDPAIQHTVLIGALGTLEAAGAAIGCAILVGAVFATGRLSDHWPVRWTAGTVVEVARALPLLPMMLVLFFAFPDSIGAFGAVVIALTVYNGAVLAEAFRAGMNAVPRGEREAAQALGLRKTQVMVSVLFPQAIRAMLPTMISQCVVTLKDTALGYVITYDELLSKGRAIFNAYSNIIPTVIVIAVLYIGFNLILSGLATWLHRRLSTRGVRRTAAPVAAPSLVAAAPLADRPDRV